MLYKFLILAFTLFLTGISSLTAKNIYVNDNSQLGDVFTFSVGLASNNGLTKFTPKLTLTDALAIAAANDSIYIDAGTYNNEVSLNLTINGVKIVGAGYNATIIDNLYAGTATNYFLYINANNITLKDLKVTGYENNGTQNPGHSGQAITIGGGASPISGILIENIAAILNGQSGGNPAITVLANTTATITGGGSFCNTAGTAYTGGIEAYGKNINLLITDYLLGNNYKVGSFDGGGLRIEGDATTIVKVQRTLISKNIASQGGGISVINGDLKMYDCIIDANSAGQVSTTVYGGGVYISAGNVLFSRCYFKNNFQANGSLRGGAISARYFATGGFSTNTTINAIIDSCIFQNNSPAGNGMDIYGANGFSNACNITARDCQFLTPGNYNIVSDAISPATSINVTYLGTPPTSNGSNVTKTLSSNSIYTPPSLVPEYTGNCPNIIIGPCTPTLSILSVSSQTLCSGNSAVITPTATLPGASSYTLNPGNLVGTSFTVTPNSSTIYSLTGTSSAGCLSVNSPTTLITVITTPTISILSLSNPTICSGNSTIITPTATPIGANTYTLMPGSLTGNSFTVSPLTNQTYSITGTNISGCASANTAVTTISVITTPTISILSLSNPTICSGNSSIITPTVNPSGAINYTLSPGNLSGTSFTVNPTTNTTYSIIGVNAQGCLSNNTATTAIVVNTTPTVNLNSNSTTICTGNELTLNASSLPSGGAFLWSGPNSYTSSISNPTVTTSANTLQAGSYTVTVTNTYGSETCTSAPATYSVSVINSILISVVSPTICMGKSVTIIPTGANNYTVTSSSINQSGTSFTLSPTALTTYTIVGSSGNGCDGVSTFSINVNSLPTLSLSAIPQTICSGESSTLTIAGTANTYTWSSNANNSNNTSVIVNPLGSGTFTVTGTENTTGCSNQATVNITVNTTPTVTIGSGSNAICEGGSTTLNLTGATSYTLTNPTTITTNTVILTPTSQTTYTIIGETIGCVSSPTTITINVNSLPQLSSANQTICAGTAATLIANNADVYNWLPSGEITPSISVSPTISTTYSVSGTNTLTGCTSTINIVNVTVNALPTVTASSNPSITCSSGIVTLLANTTATSYTWTLGNGITGANQNQNSINFPANTLNTGTYIYTVTVTSSDNCVSVPATTTLNIINVPNAEFNLSDLTICQNQNGTISINTPQSGVTYNWTVGNESISNSNPISVPGSITSTNGQYTVTVIASIGSCTNSASNTLTVNPLPTVSILNPTVTTCENTEAQFDVLNASSNNTYQWYNSGQNISSGTSLSIKSVNESNAGTYTVTVTDANGCLASATGLLVIDECDTFIPEIFTPNGDGKNDGFEIKNIKKYPKNNLKIFNRWGNLVYQKDAYNNEFEGYANEGNAVGKGKLPAGTYYIVLDYGDGKTKVYNGILQLQY